MTVCKGSNCVIPIYLQLLNLNTFRFPIFSHAKKRWSVLCVNCGCHKNWYLYSLSARSSALAQIIYEHTSACLQMCSCVGPKKTGPNDSQISIVIVVKLSMFTTWILNVWTNYGPMSFANGTQKKYCRIHFKS